MMYRARRGRQSLSQDLTARLYHPLVAVLFLLGGSYLKLGQKKNKKVSDLS